MSRLEKARTPDEELQDLAKKAVEGDALALLRAITAVVRREGSSFKATGTGPTMRGALRVEEEPLHDRLWIQGDRLEWMFFATPIGSYEPGRAHVKSKHDTNMLTSCRLSEPEQFDVTGLSFVVREDAPRDFVLWLRHQTLWALELGGGATPQHEEITWRAVRRATTEDALESDLSVPPVIPFRHAIARLENFQVRLLAETPWTGIPCWVRCILHGWHGKGTRGV